MVSCPILEASEIPFIFLNDLKPRSAKIVARPNIIKATNKNDSHVFNPKSTKPKVSEISRKSNETLINKNEVIKNPSSIPSFLAE